MSCIEYAKADVEDTLIRITVTNRGPEAADACRPADADAAQQLVLAQPRPRQRNAALDDAPGRHDGRREPRRPGPLPLPRGHRRCAACPTRSSPRTTPISAVWTPPIAGAPGLHQGRVRPLSGPWRSRGRQPRAEGHEGRLRAPARHPAWQRASRCGSAWSGRTRPSRPPWTLSGIRGRASRCVWPRRTPIYDVIIPEDCTRRRARRRPSGLCRAALEQAVLLLRRGAVGRRRPRPAGTSGGPGDGQQQGLAASLLSRRAVDARQVGVSLVRGVGPGVPHGADGQARPGFRESISCS